MSSPNHIERLKQIWNSEWGLLWNISIISSPTPVPVKFEGGTPFPTDKGALACIIRDAYCVGQYKDLRTTKRIFGGQSRSGLRSGYGEETLIIVQAITFKFSNAGGSLSVEVQVKIRNVPYTLSLDYSTQGTEVLYFIYNGNFRPEASY